MHSPDLINSHSQVSESGLEGPLVNLKGPRIRCRERCGSVVECLTQDRGAPGSSLTGVTALQSLSKTHLSYFSTGSTQMTHPCLTERLLMGHKETNQTKNKNKK